MSSRAIITVVVANRPRFVRELLSHVLPHMGEQIRVINAGNQSDLATALTHGHWLIVSEALPDHIRGWQNALQKLGVIVLGYSGSAVVFHALEHGDQAPEVINNLSLRQLAAVIDGSRDLVHDTSKPERHMQDDQDGTAETPANYPPASSMSQVAFA